MALISNRVQIIATYILAIIFIGFLYIDYFVPYREKPLKETNFSLLLMLLSGLYLAYYYYVDYPWLSIISLLVTYRYIRRYYMPYEFTNLNDFIEGEDTRWTNKCIDTLQ